jgi:hypothetical protein
MWNEAMPANRSAHPGTEPLRTPVSSVCLHASVIASTAGNHASRSIDRISSPEGPTWTFRRSPGHTRYQVVYPLTSLFVSSPLPLPPRRSPPRSLPAFRLEDGRSWPTRRRAGGVEAAEPSARPKSKEGELTTDRQTASTNHHSSTQATPPLPPSCVLPCSRVAWSRPRSNSGA